MEENVGRGSAQVAPVPNTPIVRPPRPARPVPVVQAVKRKEVPEGSEKKSEKSRREELLEMALLNSGRNLSPASATYGTGSLTHSAPKQLPGTGLTIAPVSAPSPNTLPAGISSLQGQSKLTNGKESPVTVKVKVASPVQKFQAGQPKPPLAPKPPLSVNFSPRPTIAKPAITSALQTSLNSKQIEALLSAPSIGSPTLQQAPGGSTSEGTPKGRSAAEFSFANSGNLGENTPASPNTSRDSTNSKKRAGSADSSGCNFSLQCEVCKTQVILLCCFSLLILVSRLLIPAEPYSDILPS